MAEKIFTVALFVCFWVYMIQDALLFESWRNSVKAKIAKLRSRSVVWLRLLAMPNHWLSCPFCLSLVLSCSIFWSYGLLVTLSASVLSALFHRLTFK